MCKLPLLSPLPYPERIRRQPGAHHCLVFSFQGNIVVLVHSNEDSEDEENELIVNSLCHHSDLILWVEGLATGFCKDVHGQVMHRRARRGGTCWCHTQRCLQAQGWARRAASAPWEMAQG